MILSSGGICVPCVPRYNGIPSIVAVIPQSKYTAHIRGITAADTPVLHSRAPHPLLQLLTMADPSTDDAADTEVEQDQLITPTGASTYFWGNPIWLFKDHKARAAADEADAYCTVCKKGLRYCGSTGNMKRHMEKHPHLKPPAEAPAAASGPLDKHLEQTKTFEWQATRWLVLSYQPLSALEHEAFHGMIASINPRFRIPSRRDITANLDHLEALARREIRKAITKQFCAITTDAWTSAAVSAFMSLTAHYINESFESISLPLECSPFAGSHTAERILEKTSELLQKNAIDEKYVSAVVADNAANQKKAGQLAAFDSLGCAPHTLQLTVNKIMHDPEVQPLLNTCHKIVGAFKHSALKGEELKEEQQRAKLSVRRLVQAVKTRWSSEFHCISVLCENRLPVDIVCSRH